MSYRAKNALHRKKRLLGNSKPAVKTNYTASNDYNTYPCILLKKQRFKTPDYCNAVSLRSSWCSDNPMLYINKFFRIHIVNTMETINASFIKDLPRTFKKRIFSLFLS